MKLDGFVIVPPLSAWDEKYKDKIWLDMAYHSFGKTESEAWNLYTGYRSDDIDRSIKIQKWHDKGYRVKKARLEIIE